MKKENYRVEFRMNYLPGKEFWKGEGDEEGRGAAVLMSTETTLSRCGCTSIRNSLSCNVVL